MRHALARLVLSVAVLAAAARAQSFVGSFAHGAVAADQEIASEAGARMLRAGGNAVDAAVAAGFALSVVRPQSCGIGGGGFMVIYLPEDPHHGRVLTALDFRETAPAGATPGMFTARGIARDASTDSGLAVAVPGSVAGLLYALEQYGTMDRREVLAPAILAAEGGFEADEAYVSAVHAGAERLDETERAARPWLWRELLRGGQVAVGDRIANPRQAALLRAIADEGAQAFYGDASIVAAAQDAGGILTREDLLAYAPAEVNPLSFGFGGRKFLTMPPPSSGGIVLAQAFGMLERRGIAARRDGAWTPADTHVLIEAWKHAFADRAEWLGDPAFVDVPMERLLSREYLDARAALIDDERTRAPDEYGTREESAGPQAPVDDSGTSHLCAVDQWGGAVACTQTINLEFGSLVSVEQWGFCLNNEMDDFTARPGEPNAFGLIQSARNAPEPGKRPLSSMTPTIVLDARGRVLAVAGASGGPRIITGTMQVLLNVLVRGIEAGEAVATPRLHHQWMPDEVKLEPGLRDGESAAGLRASLEARGHVLGEAADVGVVQLIVRVGDGWSAACDPRKGGRPAGH
ncbi:MAG: gamma-glutamyltransferase [Phycisphaerales bacterium]|nr:gamma-glutamyltransferase [Phycisphaerales bacterium]